jgi:hypothetical protein
VRRLHGSQGWTLTLERDDLATGWCQLDGLLVTLEQARLLEERYGSRGATISWHVTRRDIFRADGIRLTPDQAEAIARGDNPVTVLLPGALAVRALTREELTA